MKLTNHALYFILLFSSIHSLLFSMQTFRLIQKHGERLSAYIFRPGHIHVFMNNAKTVTFTADTPKNITLSTAGLTGCTATVCHAKLGDGNQMAMLTHYDPAHHTEHLAEVEYQLSMWKKDIGSFNSLNFLSILPAENYDTDQKLHLATCLKRRIELANRVQHFLPYPNIKMCDINYPLSPTGKRIAAEVHVILSNNAPCLCIIHHCDGKDSYLLE